MESTPTNPTTMVEDQLQKILQQAGLESAPFDPDSWTALKQHVQDRTEAGNPLFPPAATDSQTNPVSSSPFLGRMEESASSSSPPLPSVDIYGPTTPTKAVAETTIDSGTKAPPKAAAAAEEEEEETPVPTSQQRQALFSPMASELTDPGSASFRMGFSSAGGSSSKATSVEGARILEQLQVQTTLILNLQRRVDELTETVRDQQEQLSFQAARHVPPAAHYYPHNEDHSPPLPSDSAVPTTSSTKTTPPTTVVPPVPHEPQPPILDGTPEPAAEPQPQQQQQRRNDAPAARRRAPVWQRAWATVRQSQLVQLAILFDKVRRQQVQDFQWGVIFKVIVMLSILLGRVLSSASRRKLDDSSSASWWSQIPFKVYVLMGLVIAGFLGQTGYLNFLYHFFVKERYPFRVLVQGEKVQDILQALEEDRNPQQPPRPRPAVGGGGAALPGQNNNNNNNNNGGNNNNQNDPNQPPPPPNHWVQRFVVRGRIARPPNNNNAVPGLVMTLWNVVADVIYLLGSFFLSIFPMWRPQGDDHHPAAAEERPAAAEEEEPANPHNNDNNGPGRVQPPHDPAAADDDDDE